MNIIYIISFCIFFIITYIILQATRLPEFFRSGKMWQIRAAYILISFIVSYLITQGLHDLSEIIQNNVI